LQNVSALVIDAGARLVRREGMDIHLAPKAFDLLLILAKHRPNAVSHDALHAALWPGVHVSETSLAALVTQLRKVLGNTVDGDPVIRTLHRIGYAFIGEAVVAGYTPAIAAPACRLIWKRESFDLPAGESVIGRDRACAVRIDADSVSRHHARLHAHGSDISLEDLGSKNGTWVNGERIDGPVPLTDGTSFRLGSETLRFELRHGQESTKTAFPST
jgi:DNA-binding winged helix-turn-helix (wHTH) protein